MPVHGVRFLTGIPQLALTAGRKRRHIWLLEKIYFLAHILHGDLLGLLADYALERPLRQQSRDGGAPSDTREAKYFDVRFERLAMAAYDALDGSRRRRRNVPNCACYCGTANVGCWL